jgi:hypothetical protein
MSENLSKLMAGSKSYSQENLENAKKDLIQQLNATFKLLKTKDRDSLKGIREKQSSTEEQSKKYSRLLTKTHVKPEGDKMAAFKHGKNSLTLGFYTQQKIF